MTKRLSWWKYIAAKIDDRVEANRRKENYNKGLVEINHAALILMIAIPLATFWLIEHHDYSYFQPLLMLALAAFSLLGFGLRDYWIYRRRLKHEYHPDALEVESQLGDLSIYKPELLPSSKHAEAAPLKLSDAAAPTSSITGVSPPSIAEQTTQHLNTENRRETS